MIYRHYSSLKEKSRNMQSDLLRIHENPVEFIQSKETTDFLDQEERWLIERCLIQIYKNTVWNLNEQKWIMEKFETEFSDKEMATLVEMIGKLTTHTKRVRKAPYEKTWKRKPGKGPVGNQYIDLKYYDY